METATHMVSERVVTARGTDRLADISGKLLAVRANHCVVLDEDCRRFVGIVRLGDIAHLSNPGNRILGDLVSSVLPVGVRDREPAKEIAALFERHDLTETVVFTQEGNYVGLITSESVLKWALSKVTFAEAKAKKAELELTAQSKVRTAFLSAISHELRTPLNPVMLIASERARAEDVPEEFRRDFEIISKNMATESKLIDDLLEVTEMLSGKINLDIEVVAVHRILEQELAKFDPQLRLKRIRIERRFHASNDSVCVDERRLRQVVANVLDNAVKFTPAGGKIVLSTNSANKRRELTIKIVDSGIGMTVEKLQRIRDPFSPFDKSEEVSLYSHNGLGLGIPIAKNLVEIQNGTFKVESDGPGLGTTVTIALKLAIFVLSVDANS
jgi:signal transduction histidine kinase